MKKFFIEPTMNISCFNAENVVTASAVTGTETQETSTALTTAGYQVRKTSLKDLNITF